SLERVVHIDDLEVEADEIGHRMGVRFGPRAAASVLDALQMDQLHVRTEDVIALLVEERRGDRGVDASAHRHEDRRLAVRTVHAFEAISPTATRLDLFSSPASRLRRPADEPGGPQLPRFARCCYPPGPPSLLPGPGHGVVDGGMTSALAGSIH